MMKIKINKLSMAAAAISALLSCCTQEDTGMMPEAPAQLTIGNVSMGYIEATTRISTPQVVTPTEGSAMWVVASSSSEADYPAWTASQIFHYKAGKWEPPTAPALPALPDVPVSFCAYYPVGNDDNITPADNKLRLGPQLIESETVLKYYGSSNRVSSSQANAAFTLRPVQAVLRLTFSRHDMYDSKMESTLLEQILINPNSGVFSELELDLKSGSISRRQNSGVVPFYTNVWILPDRSIASGATSPVIEIALLPEELQTDLVIQYGFAPSERYRTPHETLVIPKEQFTAKDGKYYLESGYRYTIPFRLNREDKRNAIDIGASFYIAPANLSTITFEGGSTTNILRYRYKFADNQGTEANSDTDFWIWGVQIPGSTSKQSGTTAYREDFDPCYLIDKDWHTPTSAQMQELIDNHHPIWGTWKNAEDGTLTEGVYFSREVIPTPTILTQNNYLFLPANGFKQYNYGAVQYEGTIGHYWTYEDTSSSNAGALTFQKSEVEPNGVFIQKTETSKERCMSVRCVKDKTPATP